MLHVHRKSLLFFALVFSLMTPVIATSQTVSDSIAPTTDLSLPFAAVAADKQSAPEIITLSNPLTGALPITNIQIVGPDSTEFLLDFKGGPSPCIDSSPTIPAGGKCSVSLRFTPNGTAAGPRTAFLSLSLGSQKIAFHDTTTRGISLYDLLPKTTTPLSTPGTVFEDSSPSWSPGGNMIIFTRHLPNESFGGTLMTVPLDQSSAPTQLLENAGTPAWSPDGRKIAYGENTFGGIQFFDLTSGLKEKFFGGAGSPGELRTPSWLINGKELVFHRANTQNTQSNQQDILKVNLVFDGTSGVFIKTGPEKILSSNGDTPAWSPDGQKIAFQNRSTTPGKIDMVDPNGIPMPMTTHPVGDNPSWSPNSSQIVFHRLVGLEDHIIIVNADGTGEQPSISTTGRTPAWSPDGKQIVLSGTGLAVGTNSPPSAPQLVDPKDKQPGLGPSVTLSWLPSTDPEGDAIHYEYTVCETADFVGCTPKTVQLAQSEQKELMFAGIGFLFFGSALIAGKRKGKTAGALLLMMIIAAPLLFSACSGGGSSSNNPENNNGNDSATHNQAITQVVSNLNTNTTYYWQITAIDTSDAETKSVVRQFST